MGRQHAKAEAALVEAVIVEAWERAMRVLDQRERGRADDAETAEHCFLELAQSAGLLEPALHATQALTTNWSWTARRRRAAVTALAGHEGLMACLQAASSLVELDVVWLAALTQDASEASLDALVPYFDRARRAADRRPLQLLSALRVHASSQALGLLDGMARELDERSQQSADLFRRAGLAVKGGHLAFTVQCQTVGVKAPRDDRTGPARNSAWANLTVDTHVDATLTVRVERRDRDGHYTERELDTSNLPTLQQDLAALAAELELTWDFERAKVDGLKGQRRVQAVRDWLGLTSRTGRPSAP
jgi:hypothetical protein